MALQEKSLIISIDIGTTYSAASYTILKAPSAYKIVGVTYYNDEVREHTKVPSVLLYDARGKLLACGWKALEMDAKSQPNNYIKVEWFKLELKPRSINTLDAPKLVLPFGRTVDDIFADFLDFMKGSVKKQIEESTSEGAVLWSSFEGTAHYILAHPNGWAGNQRDRMRKAAVKAGLVPDAQECQARVRFVTEGEASLHWCLIQGAHTFLNPSDHLIVADLGGGTIDISTYCITESNPIRVKETSAPACIVAGSLFVTRAFAKSSQAKLANSPLWPALNVNDIVDAFDTRAKRTFRAEDTGASIAVGRLYHNDPNSGIENGTLYVDRNTVVAAFQRPCDEIVSAVKKQIPKGDGSRNSFLFLVGGFAASPYIFSEIKRRLGSAVSKVQRANSDTAKAVSDGAITWYLERMVTGRIARETYGFTRDPMFKSSNPSHKARVESVYKQSNGKKYVKGGFFSLMRKGEAVVGNAKHTDNIRKYEEVQQDFPISFDLYRYIGDKEIHFLDEDTKSKFEKVCVYSAILPRAALRSKRNWRKSLYYRVEYDLIIDLGSMDMTCRIEWTDPKSSVLHAVAAESSWVDL